MPLQSLILIEDFNPRGVYGWIGPSAWLFQGMDLLPASAGGRVNPACICVG